MIASVSGKRIVNVVPWSGVELTSTVPLMAWMRERTASMPTPRPETSVTWVGAVLKPGCQM